MVRLRLPEILDQGAKPYCSAYAIAGATNFKLAKAGKTGRVDADQLYRETMMVDGDGMTLSQVFVRAANKGIPLLDKTRVKLKTFWRVTPTSFSVREELQKNEPLPFTFQVSRLTFSDLVCGPDFILAAPLASHSMVITGDLENNLFEAANSFGQNWKDKGYFKIPAMYLKTPWLTDIYSFTIDV